MLMMIFVCATADANATCWISKHFISVRDGGFKLFKAFLIWRHYFMSLFIYVRVKLWVSYIHVKLEQILWEIICSIREIKNSKFKIQRNKNYQIKLDPSWNNHPIFNTCSITLNLFSLSLSMIKFKIHQHHMWVDYKEPQKQDQEDYALFVEWQNLRKA